MSTPTLSSTFLLPPEKIARKYRSDTPYHEIFNIDPETYAREEEEIYNETLLLLLSKLKKVNSMYTLAYYTLEALGAEKTLENYIKLLTAFEIATIMTTTDVIEELKKRVTREIRAMVDNVLQGDSS